MTEQTTNLHLPRSCSSIKIHQQNLNKFLTAQSDMLHILDPDKYDIAAIQEPYLYHTHNSRASANWYTLYLKEHYTKPDRARSLLLINRRIPTNNWAQIDIASSDVTAVQVQTPWGQALLINMYNNGKNPEGVRKVMQYMRNMAQANNSRLP